MILLDFALLALMLWLCWSGYRRRRPWLEYTALVLFRLAHGRGFAAQLFTLGPMIVGWLLLCHWINTHAWHATAAGLVLLGMTLGLALMRQFEEMQKWEKSQCDSML